MTSKNNDAKHVAFDAEGNQLPLSDDEVVETTLDILKEGKLILVVSEINGTLGVNVMGPPSWETLNILEQITESYRKALEAQK
jgi:hypothetical protein